MKYWLSYLFALVFSGIATTSLASQSHSLYAVTEHLPPLQIGVGEQLVGGSVGDKIKQALVALNPKLRIEVLPWARAFQIASTRPNTIIFSIVRTPEREDQFIWVDKIAQVTTTLIALKSSNINAISSLDQLKAYRIGVKRSDAITELLEQHGFKYEHHLFESVDTDTTFEMLMRNRVDLIPSSTLISAFYCEKLACEPDQFNTVYTFSELSADFYIAASLGTDQEVITQLKAALNSTSSQP